MAINVKANILNARHNFEKARHELILASVELCRAGGFKNTVPVIEDNVADFSKTIDLLTSSFE